MQRLARFHTANVAINKLRAFLFHPRPFPMHNATADFHDATVRPCSGHALQPGQVSSTRAFLGILIKPDKDESCRNVLGGDLCTRQSCSLLLGVFSVSPLRRPRIDSAQVTVHKRASLPHQVAVYMHEYRDRDSTITTLREMSRY